MLSAILKPVLGLSVEDFPRVAKEHFGALPEMDQVWPYFEEPSHAILDNFWSTLDRPSLDHVMPMLEANSAKIRGVAYEGAAMALMFLDTLLPYRRRVKALLAGPCGVYRPMVYVGAGMILPRLPMDPLRVVDRFKDDPERWCMLDGYGFLDGFFNARACLDRQSRPDGLAGEAARNFDSGVGRSLYFTSAANPDRIASVLRRFPESRRRDLWGGVGLACGYTGGAMNTDGYRRLLATSGDYAVEVAVGLAAAAALREQTSHPADHTDGACQVFWGMDAGSVAHFLAEVTRIQPQAAGPRYEEWRRCAKSIWSDRHELANGMEGVHG
ncbi:DUF1702 family protein [Tsukamurella sp. 8F]|nr:DUF1702 family protein [Tsukamurella sp. 8F]MDF0588921.1 DUF1702 family protein [Tsukamurella sp. 8F]